MPYKDPARGREAQRKYIRRWYQKNKDHKKAYQYKYSQEKRDKIKEYFKNRRQRQNVIRFFNIEGFSINDIPSLLLELKIKHLELNRTIKEAKKCMNLTN